MKKLSVLFCILCILLYGCGAKCTVILNTQAIKDVINNTPVTEVTLNTPISVGDLDVTVYDVNVTEDTNNQGPSSFSIIVGLTARNNGSGACKMSDAIEVGAFTNDLSTQYTDSSSNYDGTLGIGQQLLKNMRIESGKDTYGVVSFNINDRDDTSNLKIFLMISNQIFVLSSGTQEPNQVSDDSETEAAVTTNTVNEVAVEEIEVNPLEEDSKAHPFLKFAATSEIIAPVYHDANQVILSQSRNNAAPQFTYDLDDIALALKRVTVVDGDPINIGNFTIYDTDNGEFIANKGDPKEKSVCKTGYKNITLGEPFTNQNGDLFFYSNGEIFHMASGTNSFNCFRLWDHWFSKNGRFVANFIQSDDVRIYTIIDLGTMQASFVKIPESAFVSKEYSRNNFVVSDNGDLIICDGVICGVGDKWKNSDFAVFVTGISSNNIYRANFSGIPLFVNNEYLLYTDKFQMKKLSLSGNEILLNYLDFEQPYYDILLEELSSDPSIMLFGSTYRYRSNQCIFSENGSFSQDTPAYSFDLRNLSFSKVKFDKGAEGFIDSSNSKKVTSTVNTWSVEASSQLSEKDISHKPQYVQDSDIKTAWVEGVGGAGIDEWIQFNSDSPQNIKGIKIINGYAKSDDLYYKNNRIKEIMIVAQDYTLSRIILSDNTLDFQNVDFGRTINCSSIKIYIKDVYKGSKFDDTCISEISVY